MRLQRWKSQCQHSRPRKINRRRHPRDSDQKTHSQIYFLPITLLVWSSTPCLFKGSVEYQRFVYLRGFLGSLPLKIYWIVLFAWKKVATMKYERRQHTAYFVLTQEGLWESGWLWSLPMFACKICSWPRERFFGCFRGIFGLRVLKKSKLTDCRPKNLVMCGKQFLCAKRQAGGSPPSYCKPIYPPLQNWKAQSSTFRAHQNERSDSAARSKAPIISWLT